MGFFDKSYDLNFDFFTTIAFILFSVELLLLSLVNPEYLFGFYFWLDLISTVSMITDIGYIWNNITGT
jgi:hypothetical protein